ncbi:uncharacterized protein LOC134207752 [Armigeres subalbatus]|uniref:uncharacterized protein LOC134207752 n=1 Tax=Armigeres subalbatus TaxID=124917 RepID=UPI002ED1EE34
MAAEHAGNETACSSSIAVIMPLVFVKFVNHNHCRMLVHAFKKAKVDSITALFPDIISMHSTCHHLSMALWIAHNIIIRNKHVERCPSTDAAATLLDLSHIRIHQQSVCSVACVE